MQIERKTNVGFATSMRTRDAHLRQQLAHWRQSQIEIEPVPSQKLGHDVLAFLVCLLSLLSLLFFAALILLATLLFFLAIIVRLLHVLRTWRSCVGDNCLTCETSVGLIGWVISGRISLRMEAIGAVVWMVCICVQTRVVAVKIVLRMKPEWITIRVKVIRSCLRMMSCWVVLLVVAMNVVFRVETEGRLLVVVPIWVMCWVVAMFALLGMVALERKNRQVRLCLTCLPNVDLLPAGYVWDENQAD